MEHLLLVEDNLLFALKVRAFLEEYYPATGILHSETAKGARERLESRNWDIALVDVILETELAGIELALELRKKDIPVIFMASFERIDLFESALEAEPYNYLQKPFTGIQLKQAIDLALRHARKDKKQTENQFVFFKDNGKMLVKIPVSDIYLIESFGNYCHFHTISGRYTHRMALKNFTDFISSDAFIRINRNNVVNVNFVTLVDRKEQKVHLRNKELSLSRRYRSDLFKALPDNIKLF